MMRISIISFTALLMLLVGAQSAHAYIDPGSGGMIVQLLLGGVAGVVILARLFWRRLLTAIGLRKEDGPPR